MLIPKEGGSASRSKKESPTPVTRGAMMNQAQLAAGLLLLVVGGLCSGCSYSSKRGWYFDPVDVVLDSVLDRKSDTDRLWEQGYGYNNPNANRCPNR